MPAIEPKGPQIPIRSLRVAHGLNIPELVRRIQQHGADPDPDTISNIELGHKKGSDTLMTAWAKALGVLPLDVYQPELQRRPLHRKAS